MHKPCPYKASNNGACSHRGSKMNNKGKRNSKGSSYCNYSNEQKCPMYKEWKAKAEKSILEPLKSRFNEVESEDES